MTLDARRLSTASRGAVIVALVAGGCGGSLADDSLANADASAWSDAGRARGGAGGNNGGGLTSCSGGACPHPGPARGFAAVWRPPTGAHQGLCTPAMIDEYYQDCLALAGAQLCAAFGPTADASHRSCGKCISSSFGDAAWGPLVRSRSLFETNAAGCIALLDPGALDCAKAVQAAAECNHAACDPVCALSGSSTAFDDWIQCTAASNACACKPWVAASDCLKALAAGGGPATACLVGQTFQDLFLVTAPIFCGL